MTPSAHPVINLPVIDSLPDLAADRQRDKPPRACLAQRLHANFGSEMSSAGKRVAIELRLPAAFGPDAIRERALTLAGFQWDTSSTLRPKAQSTNPAEVSVLLNGWLDSDGVALLRDDPDVLAVWAVENDWWDRPIFDKRKN